MSAFRVTIRAEGLRVAFNGAETRCGFYKNEYVWAKNSEDAIGKARANVEAGLRRHSAVHQADVDRLALGVHEVEALGLLGVLRRQGFVFYPLDEGTSDRCAS